MKISDKIVDLVIEGLDAGTVAWRKPWKDVCPMNAFSRHEYQGLNTLLLSFLSAKCNYPYPFFGTFRQITEAGGRVKKGEKSFPVVYWKVTEDDDAESIENEKSGGKEKKMRFTPFSYYVFNLSQTEGIEIEKYTPDLTPKENSPLETCEMVITGMPHPPCITHQHPGAFYAPFFDVVNVPGIKCFDSSQEYYAVTFHELAHATGHSSRLNRFEDSSSVFGKKSYNYEELVAEMASTFLCSHCGIDQTVDNSVAYLTGWAKFLKTERKTTLFGAASKAQAAVNYILGKRSENQQEEQIKIAS